MMIKKIKALIFDLDGTLVNTDKVVINSYRAVFKKFRPDYKLTTEEEISFLGPTLKETFPKYFEEDFKHLVEFYHDYAFSHMKDEAELYADVEKMLSYFNEKGYLVCLVTSRFHESLSNVFKYFDLKHYFKEIITLDDVKEAKPSPEGINKIKNKYKLLDDEIIYIGDNKTDYLASKNANVKSGLVSWAHGRDNALLKPDLLIKSYLELIKIFEEKR